MKIEKLNENKIRITLDINDLKEKNIDFHSFMSNSIDSQALFIDMLEQAEEEIGFITKDYKIMLEALATSDGNFILTVTRILPEIENDLEKKRKVKVSRKSPTLNKDIAIYEFNTFDDFCDFCISLDNSLLKSFKTILLNSSLYSYENSYYLTLSNITASKELLKSFCSYITEFATYVHKTQIFHKKLLEYGKVIMKKNAIKTCKKHF